MTLSSAFQCRITVAIIAAQCYSRNKTFNLAIENDSAKKRGVIAYGAVGGGAVITDLGMKELQMLGNITFEEHIPPTGYDARMVLGAKTEEKLAQLRMLSLRTIINWGRDRSDEMIELCINRELKEEFTEDAPAIIPSIDLLSIRSSMVGWKLGTMRKSNRGPQNVYTTPLYLCHNLNFEDDAVVNRLLNDPLKRVRSISKEELATTKNGKQEGRTLDGYPLYTNVFPHQLIRTF